MSVHKTAQGTYRARTRDAAGRPTAKTFKLKADATNWERDQLQLRTQGVTTSKSRITVTEWADIWLAGARNLAPGTLKTYRRDLDRYILPELGNHPLNKITADHIDAYLTGITNDFAPSTVHRHYRTLHRMFAIAVERHRMPINVCTPVKPPKIIRTEMRFLTATQVEALADAIGDRYRLWVLVAGFGALRWGELQALHPRNVDGARIKVVEQMNGASLKTLASTRTITLPASVAVELADHMAKYSTDQFVFANRNGKPYSHSSFTGNVFKPALTRAGLDRNTRIHDLRHTAIALAIATGAHPKVIQQWAGHSSFGVTMDRYGHLFPGTDDTLATALDVLRTAAR
jgi:integrase